MPIDIGKHKCLPMSIGIGKHLCVCQHFSDRGPPGDAGPPDVNLGPPNIS